MGTRLAIGAGLIAMFLVAIAGNMWTPVRFLEHPSYVWNANWWQSIGWQSSRVVIDHGSPTPETINEFPSFSFILADLHPHVMALPFTILALAIAVNLLFVGRDENENWPWWSWARARDLGRHGRRAVPNEQLGFADLRVCGRSRDFAWRRLDSAEPRAHCRPGNGGRARLDTLLLQVRPVLGGRQGGPSPASSGTCPVFRRSSRRSPSTAESARRRPSS